jgi:hypothetical protein
VEGHIEVGEEPSVPDWVPARREPGLGESTPEGIFRTPKLLQELRREILIVEDPLRREEYVQRVHQDK